MNTINLGVRGNVAVNKSGFSFAAICQKILRPLEFACRNYEASFHPSGENRQRQIVRALARPA